MSIFDNQNPDIRAIGKQAGIPQGRIPALDELIRITEWPGHPWNMQLTYGLGRIHGKREERARRKKERITA